MYRIWKSFKFAASHVLSGLPEGHQCGRLHGHNYVVEVELQDTRLDDTGFVLDFGELSRVKFHLDANFDHQHLNDRLPFNPTAENMAKHLYDEFKGLLPQLTAVRVRETDTSWAEYRE